MLAFNEIRSAVNEMVTSYDIEIAHLFGPYARGIANEESGMNLCLETGRTFSLFNADAFSYTLDILLGIPIDMSTERALYNFVKDPSLRERALLYERVRSSRR